MADGATRVDRLSAAAAPGSLNPAQRQAATYGEDDADGGFMAGPLLVIAGAGTGKTMTLAHRVAHLLVRGLDVPPG